MNHEHTDFDHVGKHIAEILASSASREERARAVAAEIHAAGNYRWVGLYDVTAEAVSIIGYSGPGAPSYPSFARDRGLTGEVLRTGQTVVVGDVTANAKYLTAFATTRSEMIVPVRADGEIAGTIDVESERVDALTGADRVALERIAQALEPLFSEARR
ncbi:MAG TPA: GAF domain-containing protein [Candidatus Baltobacteraceae bacterium]|nr:GAF domain-containing protein [Candidatus Baltobacteraceae bacterium]